ncbi:MAG: glycosyltransferase [Leptolyngbya sp. SIO3F4]|nr:glycosyltransferase [Leptolyngbya sp. SIO3F4]
MIHNDIHITGLVPDVRPYLQNASVMVVPLQQGGGTRLKILEAFAARCPVISTTKGAEGLDTQDNHHLCIGDTAEQIIKKVEHLWQNQALSQQIIDNAHQLFIQTYTWAAVEKSISSALAELKGK